MRQEAPRTALARFLHHDAVALAVQAQIEAMQARLAHAPGVAELPRRMAVGTATGELGDLPLAPQQQVQRGDRQQPRARLGGLAEDRGAVLLDEAGVHLSAAKAGQLSRLCRKAMFVVSPPMRYCVSARLRRDSARPRVSSHTISLAIIGS